MNIEWPARHLILVLAPPGCSKFLRAVANAGAVGLIDLTNDPAKALLQSDMPTVAVRVDTFVTLPDCVSVVILAGNADSELASRYRDLGLYVIAEAVPARAVPAAQAIIIQGDHGSETVVSIATTRNRDKPIFARGGLDRQTLAAASKAGASGFVFAESFWLLPECDLSMKEKHQLARAVPGSSLTIGNMAVTLGVDVKLAMFVAMRAGSLQSAVNLALLDAEASLTERFLGTSAGTGAEKRNNNRSRFASEQPKKTASGSKTSPSSNSIAVIGVGAVLPKAPNVTEFWSNVKGLVDAVTEVPDGRWGPNSDIFYDADARVPDKTYTKIGGFIDRTVFNPRLFNIPPKVAEHIDDPQKWVLTATTEALHSAGYCKVKGSELKLSAFDRQRTAVILGNSMGGELKGVAIGRVMFPAVASWIRDTPTFCSLDPELADKMLVEAEVEYKKEHLPINQHSLPGGLPNIIAGRVAATFDLHGTNCIIDAACSSSLAALDFAIKGLRSGEHDMVICGGADQTMEAFSYVSFAKVGALSREGCRPFDQDADGLVMGEGASIFLLRRLEDAIDDGDQIFAVIRGIGSSSDGAGAGITAPNEESQGTALRRAYQDAGISPAFISLIEAHGTGTQRGDVAEINVLEKMYSEYDLPPRSVAISSLKSQIGHLKAGAGAAGLVKTVLSLHDKVIPPSIHSKKPTEEIDWDNTPFYLTTELADWPKRDDGEPRRAAISAFGFGGTNYHVVLEEYVPDYHDRLVKFRSRVQPPDKRDIVDIALFSGDSPDEVAKILHASADQIRAGDLTVSALASQSRAKAKADTAVRCALVLPSDSVRAVEILSAAAGEVMKPHASGVHFDKNIFFGYGAAQTGKVAFLFPGQGSQYANMGRRLAAGFPEVRQTLLAAERRLVGELGPDISRAIGPNAWNGADQRAVEASLRRAEILPPAIVAVEVAVCRLLMQWGIRPQACAGHSLGELSAMVAASSLSFEDALTACVERGKGMESIPIGERGSMAGVRSDPAKVKEILQSDDRLADISIANFNGPKQTVIAGLTLVIDMAIERLREAGIPAMKIPVGHAFHTGMVAAVQRPLAECLDRISFEAPRIPIISNVTADYYSENPDQIRQLLVEQIVSPVRWQETVERLYEDGHRIFIEVGPKNVLSDLVVKTLPGKDIVSCATLPNQDVEADGVLGVAARLFCCGLPIELPQKIAAPTGKPAAEWHQLSGDGANKSTAHTSDLSKYRSLDPSIRDNPLWPEVHKEVRRILAKLTGYDPEEISMKSRLGTDLHLDSLDLLNAFIELDEQFELPELEKADIGDLPQVSVGMLVDWITAYITSDDLAEPARRNSPPRSCRRLAVRWRPLPAVTHRVSLAEPVHVVGTGSERSDLISLCLQQGVETTNDVALARSILCVPMADSAEDFDAFLDAVRTAHSNLSVDGTIGVLIPPGPWGGAYCGFLKSLQREIASVRCRAVRNASVIGFLDEIRRADRPVEVLCHGDELKEAAYEPVPAVASAKKLQSGDVVVITGGAQGIAAACAVGLATEYPKAKFLLAGRSNLENDEVQHTLNALRDVGASPYYEQADITVRADREALIARARKLGPLRLVVHAAGIQNSGPFIKKSQEIIQQILAPKIEAVRHLVELATSNGAKPKFIFFGSVAARFGNFNQTIYAAANEFLAHFSRELCSQGVQARTLVWAPWGETGMAVKSKSVTFMKQIGVEPLSTEEGVRAFVSEVLCDDDESEVVLAKGLGPAEPFPDRLEKWSVSADDWFMADHRIGRRSEAILPGVMTMDRFCRAGNGSPSSNLVEATDVKWLSVVAAHNEKPVDLTVRVRSEYLERSTACEMWLENQSGGVVAQATLRFGKRAKPPVKSMFPSDLPSDFWQIDGAAIYEKLLPHGRSFQVLRRAGRTKSGIIVGKLMPATKRQGCGNIDPVALEGAFHVASLLHALEAGNHCVPVTTGRMVWYETTRTACYAAACTISRAGDADDHAFDLELIDRSGNVVARCEDYRVRSVGDPVSPDDMRALAGLLDCQN